MSILFELDGTLTRKGFRFSDGYDRPDDSGTFQVDRTRFNDARSSFVDLAASASSRIHVLRQVFIEY